MKQTIEKPESRVFKFTEVEVANIKGEIEKLDVSKIVGNVLYNTTPDIMAMDKAREIYHKGKVELSKKEAAYFLDILMQSQAVAAPLKVALQKQMNF